MYKDFVYFFFYVNVFKLILKNVSVNESVVGVVLQFFFIFERLHFYKMEENYFVINIFMYAYTITCINLKSMTTNNIKMVVFTNEEMRNCICAVFETRRNYFEAHRNISATLKICIVNCLFT